MLTVKQMRDKKLSPYLETWNWEAMLNVIQKEISSDIHKFNQLVEHHESEVQSDNPSETMKFFYRTLRDKTKYMNHIIEMTRLSDCQIDDSNKEYLDEYEITRIRLVKRVKRCGKRMRMVFPQMNRTGEG